MVPGIFKAHFNDRDDVFYKQVKTVLVIHDLDEYADVARDDFELAEISVHPSLKGNMLNVYDVAAFETDAIIIFDKPGKNISESLLNRPGIKANKKKVSIIKWSDDEIPDYGSISDQMDKILSKLSK